MPTKNAAHTYAEHMSMSMLIKIFSVAKIAKLLHRPRGRSVIRG